MTTTAPPPTLIPPATDVASRLRAAFADTGYDESGLRTALGTVEPPVPGLGHLPRLVHATREPSSFNILARWFFLGEAVERSAAGAHLPTWLIEACTAARLLRDDGGLLHPNALIVPCGDYFVASDRYGSESSASGFSHVLAVSPTARHLLGFVLPRRVGATLDLCCGCAIHAVAAAARSTSVVAADFNPRARDFAAFNAALNGCDNVECVTGDGFDAVDGRRFDLIVCNPPFVVAPSKQYLYRDNDLDLDAFCRALVQRAPFHLRDGGVFQMICEWVEVEGEPWPERLAGWLADAGCDAWILRANTQTPARYAEMRLHEAAEENPSGPAGAPIETWLTYYSKHRVRAIHGGFILLRKRAGTNWTCFDDIPGTPGGEASGLGVSIERGLAARDFLAAHPDDETLLAARLCIAPEVRRDERSTPAAGIWQIETTRLVLEDGLARDVEVPPDMARLLARLDGTRPMAGLADELATDAGVSLEQARAACAQLVRTMLERGFLIAPESTKSDTRRG